MCIQIADHEVLFCRTIETEKKFAWKALVTQIEKFGAPFFPHMDITLVLLIKHKHIDARTSIRSHKWKT